jgi:hypothetical protein
VELSTVFPRKDSQNQFLDFLFVRAISNHKRTGKIHENYLEPFILGTSKTPGTHPFHLCCPLWAPESNINRSNSKIKAYTQSPEFVVLPNSEERICWKPAWMAEVVES